MTTDIAQRNRYNFQMAEEYQDFKEFMSYKLDMDSDEFNELYEEFEKWHNGEIKTEDIKPI